jgi:hypothetical protein
VTDAPAPRVVGARPLPAARLDALAASGKTPLATDAADARVGERLAAWPEG